MSAAGLLPSNTVGRGVTRAFDAARAENRAVLVGYLPAGFPTIAGARDVIAAMVDGGVDVVEIGLPYSDPTMDGPTIARAAEIALANGTRTSDVLATVEAVAALGVPTLVMTYWNPIERYGVARFAADLAAAGGAGLITPDLLPEEAAEWLAASDANGLDRVFLVAPSSPQARVVSTAAVTRGFLYAVSIMGVTGSRTATSSAAPELVARARAATDLPVGVGLGVSNGDQAAEVGAFADAVIVGSAFVRAVLDAPDTASGLRAVRALAEDLSAGVRRRGGSAG
ncbi:MAG TPA: tryptophan synthase subunit alpha [Actinopolymorphaceae bacterium]